MANNLRTLREKYRITQAALEDASGVSQVSISALETTDRIPGLLTARRLADGLSRLADSDITVEDLFPPEPGENGKEGGQ